MNYDELLKKKKEVDELSLYYKALKDKQEKLNDIFYSNNLLDIDDFLEDKESINEKIRKERIHYIPNKMIGYFVRYALILIANAVFDLPRFIYISGILINLAYYTGAIFGYEKIMRFKLERESNNKVNFEELMEEKEKLDCRLEYVRDKYFSKAREYEKLASELEESEYQEYLEYISEYLQYMLENSQELLMEILENVEENDDEIIKDDDQHRLRLN